MEYRNRTLQQDLFSSLATVIEETDKREALIRDVISAFASKHGAKAIIDVCSLSVEQYKRLAGQ